MMAAQKRIRLAALACCALLLTLLPACGGGAAPPPGDEGFDITLAFVGALDDGRQQIVAAAADRWEQAIVGDLAGATVSTDLNGDGANDCEPRAPSVTEAVDDLLIHVLVEDLDAGALVAVAGPCVVRGSRDADPLLPAYGVLILDRAAVSELSDALLFDVALHEIGHVLGFGTLWEEHGLLEYQAEPPDTPCRLVDPEATSPSRFEQLPAFVGASAVALWSAEFGGEGGVPVEDGGGAGTQCGHWDEETFGRELMTGTLAASGGNPLDALTIRALQDLGYRVDAGAEDPYARPACSLLCPQAAAEGLDLGARELLLRPAPRSSGPPTRER